MQHRRLPAHRLARMPAGSRDDDGFTLIEVVVAMVVFAVFVSVSLGLLVRTGGVTRGNLQRTAAANLAAEQIQMARGLTATDSALADGTTSRTSTVKGTVYTIKQTTRSLSQDATNSVCDGSATALAYKLVSVAVTWPDMGSIKPVRQDTLKSIGVGSDGLGNTGALALQVSGSDGVGGSGFTVTLSNGSTTVTDDTGCAVFTGVPVGTYSATLNALGYVGLANMQLTTKSGIGVTAGVLTRGSISYDEARSVTIVAGAPVTGYVIPSGLTVQLSSSSMSTPTSYAACPAVGTSPNGCTTAPVTAANGVAQGLYPSIYTVKLGTCTESAPSATLSDLSAASTSPSVTVPMGAITVNLTRTPAYTGTKVITVKHTSGNSGCSTPETFTVTASTGVKILIPYGAWTVSVPTALTGSATSTSGTITLSAQAQTATANLVVTS